MTTDSYGTGLAADEDSFGTDAVAAPKEPSVDGKTPIQQLTEGLGHLDALRAVLDDSEEKLEQTRDRADADVAGVKEKWSTQVAEARERGNAEINALRAKVNAEIEEVRLSGDAEVASAREEADTEIGTVKASRDEAFEAYSTYRNSLVKERKLTTNEVLEQSGHPTPRKKR